jgi:tungstate transport system substrate-binding protein
MGHHAARILWIGILLLSAGCGENSPSSSPELQPRKLTLATTTSTRDSGLLDALLPVFREQTGIDVKVVAVGSGQAIELGRRGDADVLLTHAPDAEQKFVEEGFAKERIPVFYNDFVLIGPDSPSLRENFPKTVSEALTRIASENRTFISRGDDSGTHRKEQALWKAAGIEPTFSNYLSSGSGMAQTLRVAEEKQGWTLTDRGTFLVLKSEIKSTIQIEGDPELINPYAVMAVDPVRHPHVEAQTAQEFIHFLKEESTRKLISEFGKDKYGQALFFVK